MKQNVYVVVGQYNQKKNSSALNELIDCLKKLGEVNIFDMKISALRNVFWENLQFSKKYANIRRKSYFHW